MWKDYFYFSKSDRRAIVILLIIIALVIICRLIVPSLRTVDDNFEVKDTQEYNDFIQSLEE